MSFYLMPNSYLQIQTQVFALHLVLLYKLPIKHINKIIHLLWLYTGTKILIYEYVLFKLKL